MGLGGASSVASRVGLSAVWLLLTTGGCIQPDEKSGAEFGTFVGNAVAADEDGGGQGEDPGASAGEGNGGSGEGASAGAGGGDNGAGAGPGGDNTQGGGDNGGNPDTDGGGPPVGEPDAGTGGAGGDPTGGDPGPGGASGLTFTVLTKPIGGRYAPKNIGAIWITDAGGAFVKTLKVWANRRLQYLTTFQAQTNRNRVDAVSSATLTSHQTHTVTWDLKDVNGNLVPDGTYKLVIETTDQNSFGDSLALTFEKGAPTQLSPGDEAHYTNMSIKLE